ncbi:MAG: DUF2079 domain-containing protein [Acidimicrobiales bacterium]
MSELPIQRRASRRLIRFQARLEASVGDRWIPPIVALLLAIFLSTTASARIAGLDAGRDLAGYTQAVWLLAEGFKPEASMFGQDVHVLELHWSFILYPLSLLARVWDPASVLVVTQAIALGVGVFPLWKLARNVAHLRIGAASALVGAYALHPTTHRLGVVDFHPESLAVPALLALVYFGATKRWILYWVCVVVVLSCRADLGLAVAPWGFVLLGDGERRAGLWTMGVASFWALGLLLVVQPIFGEATVAGGQYGAYGDSLGEAAITSITSPLQLLADLTARDNMSLIVALLAPVIFLPFLSLRHLLPSVPLGALYLVTDAEGSFAERSALLLAFVFIAATYALNRLGDMGVDRVFVDVRLLSTVVVASLLLSVSSSPLAPYDRPWNWAERDATDEAILEIAESLPDDIVIRASESALTPLAERYWLTALDGSRAPVALIDLANTRALLIVDRDIPEMTDAERAAFTSLAENSGFEVTHDDRTTGVTLYFRP